MDKKIYPKMLISVSTQLRHLGSGYACANVSPSQSTAALSNPVNIIIFAVRFHVHYCSAGDICSIELSKDYPFPVWIPVVCCRLTNSADRIRRVGRPTDDSRTSEPRPSMGAAALGLRTSSNPTGIGCRKNAKCRIGPM